MPAICLPASRSGAGPIFHCRDTGRLANTCRGRFLRRGPADAAQARGAFRACKNDHPSSFAALSLEIIPNPVLLLRPRPSCLPAYAGNAWVTHAGKAVKPVPYMKTFSVQSMLS